MVHAEIDFYKGTFSYSFKDLFVENNSPIFERHFDGDCINFPGIFGNGMDSDFDGSVTIEKDKIVLNAGCGRLIDYTLDESAINDLKSINAQNTPLDKLVANWPPSFDAHKKLSVHRLGKFGIPEYIPWNGQIVSGGTIFANATFDLKGRMTSGTNSYIPYKLDYDLTGKLSNITRTDLNVSFPVEYKTNSIIIHGGKPFPDVIYTYDNKRNLISVRNSFDHILKYEYDKHNKLVKVKFPNNEEFNFAYEESGHLSHFIAQDGCDTSYTYTFNSDKQLTATKGLAICKDRYSKQIKKFIYSPDHIIHGAILLDYKDEGAEPKKYSYVYQSGGMWVKSEEIYDIETYFDSDSPEWVNGVRLDEGSGVLANEPVRDQGNEGDCTAQVAATMWDAVLNLFGIFNPDRPVDAFYLNAKANIKIPDDKRIFLPSDIEPNLLVGGEDGRNFAEGSYLESSLSGAYYEDRYDNLVRAKDRFLTTNSGLTLCDEFALRDYHIGYNKNNAINKIKITSLTQKKLLQDIISNCHLNGYYNNLDPIFKLLRETSPHLDSNTTNLILNGYRQFENNSSIFNEHKELKYFIGLSKIRSEAAYIRGDHEKEVFSELVDAIKAGIPIGAQIHVSDLLSKESLQGKNLSSLNDDHAIIIDGFRKNPVTGVPQFLIRNSWGNRCPYRNEINDFNCEPLKGSVWINFETLLSDQILETYLYFKGFHSISEFAITNPFGVKFTSYSGLLVGPNISDKTLHKAILIGEKSANRFQAVYSGGVKNGGFFGPGQLTLTQPETNRSCVLNINFTKNATLLNGSMTLSGEIIENSTEFSILEKGKKVKMDYHGSLTNSKSTGHGYISYNDITIEGNIEGGIFKSPDKKLKIKFETCGI